MKWTNQIRVLAILALFAVLPCDAQEFEGWHARGVVGFDYSGNNFTPINTGIGQSSSPSSAIGGELGLDLSGIIVDPKFITFDTNFNFMHGANSVNELGYSNGVIGGGADVEILPSSHYPLELFYQRTGADTSGSLFGSNTDMSQFRARWTLDLPHAPHLVLAYNDTSSDVVLPTSISNTGYKQSDWSVQANDRLAGFFWSAGLNFGKFDETAIGDLSLAGGVDEDYRTFNVRAYRSFWDGKALFNTSVYDQHYSFDFPGQGTSLSDDLLYSANLQLQHTRKLSSHYSYALSHLNESSNLTGTESGVTVLNPPTLDTQSVGAEVDYQLAQPVRIFQGVQYAHLTPLPGFESETSSLESDSGVSVIKRWRGFDLSGTYTGRLQTLNTNLSNTGRTWSNNGDARVGWGDVRKLRLTGNYRYDRLNLVQEIGGFSQFNVYGAQAETSRFLGVRLSGGWDHGKVDLLNLSGDTKRTYNNYMAQLESRRLHLMASRGLNDGSGSIFPTPLTGQFYINVPLPVSQLFSTPLLNINSQTTNFSLTARPTSKLEIGAYFRKENDVLISSAQNYRLWEIRAQYRIGKVSVDAGFGNLHSSINQNDSLSGLGINRYWFRIRRSFNLF
ncbi:MAG: hypothetical protein WBX03_16260 [Terriglobales bacterium]|jgi:hypothetical protein